MKHYTLIIAILFSIFFPASTQAKHSVTDFSQGPVFVSASNTPAHPILESQNVRKAIAYCIDKTELVEAAFPDLNEVDQQALILDTLFTKDHWAYTSPTTLYPHNPAMGQTLLESEGWLLEPGDQYRTKNGQELALALSTTDAPIRQAYAPVLRAQLAECGIRVTNNHYSSAWLFSTESGLSQRDFELSSFTWILDPADTNMEILYGCNFIPSVTNHWTGENYMGVCNPQADALFQLGDDSSKTHSERSLLYDQAIELLLQDVVSIPLFERPESDFSFEHLDLNLDLTATQPTPQSHPINKDVNVRQAIAYCIDKQALVEAVYPSLSESEQLELVNDSYFPKAHWAYAAPTTVYPFNPETGKAMLASAGWLVEPGDSYRSKNGRELALTLVTTSSSMRQAYALVLQSQLAACGVRLNLNHTSAAWLFGDETGIARRDFELTSFAWIKSQEGIMLILYGCSSIPMRANDWQGQNYSGWCNPQADEIMEQGDDSNLPQGERAAFYAQAVEMVLQGLPSIPLFDVVAGGYTIEHLDFNLDTFNQVYQVESDTDTLIPVVGFESQGSINIPAGAVSQPVELSFHPLFSATNGVESGLSNTIAFQLDVIVDGQAQQNFTFDQPIRVNLNYTDASVMNIDESSLRLYLWDGAVWQDAALSCPVADRYFALDTASNHIAVNICHLTEFGVIGENQYQTMLPLIIR